MNAKDRIIKARTNLVLTSPFFASIALQLKLQEDKDHPTAYTDSVVLGYNPDFISKLTDAELTAVICHEVLHIAMLHPFRRDLRMFKKWNIACDYAINPIVNRSGYFLPKEAVIKPEYDNLEAEVIYSILPETPSTNKNQLMIGEVRDYQQKTSQKAYQNTINQQKQNWKIKISNAANIAKAQGKLPAELDRAIKEILQPKLPWEEILARFITENARDDYSWKQPNGRYLYAGLYLPTLRSAKLNAISVIIDTSGSVRQNELEQFATELQAILSLYSNTEILVIYVDTKVANVETITFNNLELHAKGGGGTDFRPGFEYLQKENLEPACILYFTDGYCRKFPEKADSPTLWILTSQKRFEPPFGEVIKIENIGDKN